jgi:lipoyl-dependent peroxiredoxin
LTTLNFNRRHVDRIARQAYHWALRAHLNASDRTTKETIMITRNATANWNGNLKEGKGHLELGSGAYQGPYSFRSRFADGNEVNPEELLGAAHAGCYSMALSAGLSGAGHVPTSIKTTAKVRLEQTGASFTITLIELETEAQVPGIDNATFQKFAEETKLGCPVSKALSATPVTLKATLLT